jgi:hypothetical protein
MCNKLSGKFSELPYQHSSVQQTFLFVVVVIIHYSNSNLWFTTETGAGKFI